MPTPPANAIVTTFQVGLYNAVNDIFTEVLDLNDFATFWIEWNSMKMPQPEKVYVRSFNIRTPGEPIYRYQYKNRHLTVSVRLKNTTPQNVVNVVRTFLSAVEFPPYTIRLALPGATQYSYFDVVAVKHNIPSDPQALLALIIPSIQIDFECKPGIRGDRQHLQNLVFNPGMEAPSGPAVSAFNDPFANTDAYTTQVGTAPSVAANVMTIPSGTRVSFGSPAWSGINLWQIRFKWVTGLTATFYPHYTDGNDWIAASFGGANMVLQHDNAGTTTTDSTTAAALTNGNFYWVQVSLFVDNVPPRIGGTFTQVGVYETVTIFNDSAGSIGSQIATSSVFIGPFSYISQLQIAAAGAALAIGGAFSNVNAVWLFGPGGWTHGVDAGTGQTALAWEGSNLNIGQAGFTSPNTYSGGPVTSFGALRVDLPPTGTINQEVSISYTGGGLAGTSAITVVTAGDVLGVSAWLASQSLGSNAVTSIGIAEYNSGGTFLRSGTVAFKNGNIGAYTQLSGTYTTGANCSVAQFFMVVSDSVSADSPNGIVWMDNVQVWDETATGATSMPYCELRFMQSPGMLITSGLLGDITAPAVLEFGGYFSSVSNSHNLYAWIGRRPISTASMVLVQPSAGGSDTLSSTSYGGFYLAANPGPFFFSAQQESGIYHLLARVETSNSAPTNNVWIAGQVFTYQISTDLILSGWQGPNAYDITTVNTWTTYDIGQLTLPVSPLPAVASATSTASYISATSGTSGSPSGSDLTVNWCALLPVDGELFLCTASVPATGSLAISNQWIYLIWDGINATTGYIAGVTGGRPNPNPASAIANFVGGAATTFVNGVVLTVTPSGDTLPTVDPTIDTSLQTGVNQYLAHFSDDTGDVVPIICDIVYSPTYLFPR